MSELIRRIRTASGDIQIDYTALANLPTARDILMSQGSKETIADRLAAIGKKLTKAKMKKILWSLSTNSIKEGESEVDILSFDRSAFGKYDIIILDVDSITDDIATEMIANDKLIVVRADMSDSNTKNSILDGTIFEIYKNSGATGVFFENWDTSRGFLSMEDQYSLVNLCHANGLFVMLTADTIEGAARYDANYNLPLCSIDWIVFQDQLFVDGKVLPANEFLKATKYFTALADGIITYQELYGCNIAMSHTFDAYSIDIKSAIEFGIAATSLVGFNGVMFNHSDRGTDNDEIIDFNIPAKFTYVNEIDLGLSYLNTFEGETYINSIDSNVSETIISVFWDTNSTESVVFSEENHYVTYDGVKLSDADITPMSIYGGAELTGSLAAPSISAPETYIVFPAGGHYDSLDEEVGKLKISLPAIAMDNNVKFTISIFNRENGTSVDYSIAGRATNDENGISWDACTALAIGDFDGRLSNLPVEFGSDDGRCIISIGNPDTLWIEPLISIHDITVNGYTRNSEWDTDWNIIIDSSELELISVAVEESNILAPISNRIDDIVETVDQHTTDINDIKTDIDTMEIPEISDEQIDALFTFA